MTDQTATTALLEIVPWGEPVPGEHKPADPYIDWFWVPVLGPSATWLWKRLCWFAQGSEQVDETALASMVGLGHTGGARSTFRRTLDRMGFYEVARYDQDANRVEVKLTLPDVADRRLAKMPRELQQMHLQYRQLAAIPPETAIPG
jgi:hypothetical protein